MKGMQLPATLTIIKPGIFHSRIKLREAKITAIPEHELQVQVFQQLGLKIVVLLEELLQLFESAAFKQKNTLPSNIYRMY